MIEPHRVSTIAVSLIDVDAGLWNSARLAWPANDANPEPAESIVFPVFARAGRLVLLSGFEMFLALLNSGAIQVNVYRVEIEAGEDQAEYAIVFSMPRDDPPQEG